MRIRAPHIALFPEAVYFCRWPSRENLVDPFLWKCPFCGHNATITEANFASNRHEFEKNNKYGYQAILSRVVTCPNPTCREFTLDVTLHDHRQFGPSNWRDLDAREQWRLVPPAEMMIFPTYIPTPILADYKESCLIRTLSPKASATLSRRCLQGMIRDFWGISKSRLVDEIDALADKVDPTTWASIDAVRKIGNIGAHMERDINLIIDVDQDEAQLLIGLIETLINDWYITRYERDQRMRKIVALAENKQAERTSGPSTRGD